MIYTLTLNPAIDRTIYVDRIVEADVTRVKKTIRDAAGKGINVSKGLRKLGVKSLCLSFTAGENGRFIKNSLDKADIDNTLISVLGETRENIKLISLNDNKKLEINELGPTITKANIDSLYNVLDIYLESNDIFVISGSIPEGISDNIYRQIIERYNHTTIILDVAGEVFKKSLIAKPNVVKPNLYELELYAGKKLKSQEEILEICHTLIDQGIKKVFVSLGKDGAIFVSSTNTLIADVPVLNAKNTVGAGDCFLAGMVKGISENRSDEDTLRYACAVGSASVLSESTASIELDHVNEILEEVKIRKI